ncbi:MAG TPA: hypothetical protein VH230_05225 [Stellaceae bacterium]|nr:hypothetical protein [Stellaceae bacterium]
MPDNAEAAGLKDKGADELFDDNFADPVAPSGRPPHDPSMDEQRLAKLEGSYDALKVVRPMTITVIGVFLAALVFVLGFFATQMSSINNKLDAIPVRLSEEFRALRAEMSAQTSAIANSITATKAGAASDFRAARTSANAATALTSDSACSSAATQTVNLF